MFTIAVVIFRESLEIALLLGVITAVTKPIKNSRRYIIAGALAGVSIASIMAFFASSITEAFGGLGDELVDAGVILFTAALISWTVVWMQGYNRSIRKHLGDLSEKINSNTSSKAMLSVVVAMTIMREGMEIILFVYSISSAHNITMTEYVWGLLVGSAAGFTTGIILYKGLINFSGKFIFKISTILLILIAAGLSAQAAGILTSIGVIEILSDQLWDSSWLIDDRSTVGKLLSITIGYDSRPNIMQIIFYFSTVIGTILMMRLKSRMLGKKSYV